MRAAMELVKPTRRGFLGLLGIGLAAPAIVRASSLMPISAIGLEWDGIREYWEGEVRLIPPPRNGLLTLDQITREAIELWKNSNQFLLNIQGQHDVAFAGSVPVRA